MTPKEGILLTEIVVAVMSPIILLYWLLFLRPINKRVSTGRLYPKGPFGLRLGAGGMTEASVRGGAAFLGLIAIGGLILASTLGYLWWFSLASYFYIWMIVMFSADLAIYPARFRKTMRTLALSLIPLVFAYALGWASFCQWMYFPLPYFNTLHGITIVVLILVTATRIPVENHTHRHRRNH